MVPLRGPWEPYLGWLREHLTAMLARAYMRDLPWLRAAVRKELRALRDVEGIPIIGVLVMEGEAPALLGALGLSHRLDRPISKVPVKL